MPDWRWQSMFVFGVSPEYEVRGGWGTRWCDADHLKVERSSPRTIFILPCLLLCFAESFLCILFRSFCGVLVAGGVGAFRTSMRSTGLPVQTSDGGQGRIVLELSVPRSEDGDQFLPDFGICSRVGGEVLQGVDEVVIHAGRYGSTR